MLMLEYWNSTRSEAEAAIRAELPGSVGHIRTLGHRDHADVDEDNPWTGWILFDKADDDHDHVTYRYDGNSVSYHAAGMEM